MEYSKIGPEANKVPVDCNELVKEVIEDLSSTIAEKGAVIRLGKLPVVNGFVYLKSVFQNLLSNSLKFTKVNEKPIIHITAQEREDYYLFSIMDNGIGIEPAYHERIFLIFQRLHGRSEYPGTGIGLSQCRKIIETHGGKIWVESAPGSGSVFKFTLPKT